MISRAELKANAKAQLKGNTGNSILVMLAYIGITAVISIITATVSSLTSTDNFGTSIIPSLCSAVITPPLALGMYCFFLKLSRGQEASVNDLFSQFTIWGKAIILYILMSFFTFLWSCLFVIPGIIAAIRYSQAYYIMLDNPELSSLEAINRSKEMMKGHKMDYFVLGLSFFGWVLLGSLTLGIAFLWIGPYMSTTYANFYRSLVGESIHSAPTARLQ